MAKTSVGRRARELVHPLYKRLETRAHVLRYLSLELSERCNLSCLHCAGDCGPETQVKELSLDEWLSFFHYLSMSFERRDLVLLITGGEPFCHPEFSRILTGIQANRLQWGMVSNGWALNKENLDLVVERGIGNLSISLDGLESTHEWLRNRRGAYDRALRAIRNAMQAKLPSLDVVTGVTPRNLDELPQLLALLKQEGVKAWTLYTIEPRGRARDKAELQLSGEQFKQLMDWIAQTRQTEGKAGVSVRFGAEGYLPPAVDRKVRDNPFFCRAGINTAAILCDGTIASCPNTPRSLAQGNILTDDFRTVWEEGFTPHRQRQWMKTGECETCSMFDQCQGNSLHLWDDEKKRTLRCHAKALQAAAGGQ